MPNKDQKVSIFDPVVNAFREVTVDVAVAYVKSVEAVKKALADIGVDVDTYVADQAEQTQ